MIKASFLMGDQDLSAVFDIRQRVFVDEQGFSAELERDGMDERAVHVLLEDDGGPCGTARLFAGDGRWHIGRMAVLKEKRGSGYGDLMLRMLVEKALSAEVDEIYVGAQCHAKGFYEKAGFQVCGEEYFEEESPHVPMVLTAQRARDVLFAPCCSGGCDGCSQGRCCSRKG